MRNTFCPSSGDILALFTDGMIEAQDKSGADYTARRLQSVIEKHRDRPMNEVLDLCLADYRAFRHQDSDDCTLILIRRKSRAARLQTILRLRSSQPSHRRCMNRKRFHRPSLKRWLR